MIVFLSHFAIVVTVPSLTFKVSKLSMGVVCGVALARVPPRFAPTPRGVQILLVGGKRVTVDRVVAAPGLGGAKVLEVKVKEAKDEEGRSMLREH